MTTIVQHMKNMLVLLLLLLLTIIIVKKIQYDHWSKEETHVTRNWNKLNLS